MNTLCFWGFRIYGELDYVHGQGTVVKFQKDKCCSAKGLFDLCLRFSCHRLKLENPELSLDQKADYMLAVMADSCQLSRKDVTLDLFLEHVKRPRGNTLVTAELMWLLHLFWGRPRDPTLWQILDRLIFYDTQAPSKYLPPHMRPVSSRYLDIPQFVVQNV